MRIKKTFLTLLTIAMLLATTSVASLITFGTTAAFATSATFSPTPDVGSASPNDENTVVGDNDTFRQFLTCMLDDDGDGEISEEEITTVLEVGSDDTVIVEEGEIKDCFQPLYVTGTGAASPTPGTNVDDISAAEDSTAEGEENSETDDDDDEEE